MCVLSYHALPRKWQWHYEYCVLGRGLSTLFSKLLPEKTFVFGLRFAGLISQVRVWFTYNIDLHEEIDIVKSIHYKVDQKYMDLFETI